MGRAVMVWSGEAGSASQVPSRPAVSRQCGVGLGSAGLARHGAFRRVSVWQVAARQSRQVRVRLGAARPGLAGSARLGLGVPSGHGTSWFGQAGVARPGRSDRGLAVLVMARLVPAGQVRLGISSHGSSGHVSVWPGSAGVS